MVGGNTFGRCGLAIAFPVASMLLFFVRRRNLAIFLFVEPLLLDWYVPIRKSENVKTQTIC